MSTTSLTDDTVQRVLALKTFPVLAGLDASDLTTIAERTTVTRFDAGAPLLPSDAPTPGVHFVIDGAVDESWDSGRPHRRNAPHVAGGLTALAGTFEEHVVAATKLTTLSLPTTTVLWELLEESFELTMASLATLAGATRRVRMRLLPSGGYRAVPAAAATEAPASLVAQIAAMRDHGPWAGAPIGGLGLLAHEAALVHADADRRLWSIGDDADRVAIVLAGRVRGTTPAGHDFELGKGAIVGADTTLASEARWFDLTTVGAVTFLDLSRERLLDVLEDDWRLARHVLQVAARELVGLRRHDPPLREEAST